MAKFSEVFSTAEKEPTQHPNMKIKWVHYSKLCRSEYQFYGEGVEEVKAMASILLADGRILQTLLIRQSDADEYEIIGGHKRTLACKYITEELKIEGYEFLPCTLIGCSDIQARFRTMSTNAYHVKTDFEKMKEIEDMVYLIKNYPEEFPEYQKKGRLVEQLAEKLKMSRSVVSDYQTISHNLSEKGREKFEKGDIGKSAATALAGLPDVEQEKLLNAGMTSHKEIKKYKVSKKEEVLDNETTLPGQYEIKDTAMNIETVKTENVKKDKERNFLEKMGKCQNTQSLPYMKNMEERETFILNYKKWCVWSENKLTEETFYRMDLPDGSAIIIRHYPYKDCWNAKEYEGCQKYLLLPSTKHFKDGESNMTTLKEHLKNVQKGYKG